MGATKPYAGKDPYAGKGPYAGIKAGALAHYQRRGVPIAAASTLATPSGDGAREYTRTAWWGR